MEIYVPDGANLVNPLRFLNSFQAVPLAQGGILLILFWFSAGSGEPPMCVCCAALSCQPGAASGPGFFWLLEEKFVSEVKNLPFKFLHSSYPDYNS